VFVSSEFSSAAIIAMCRYGLYCLWDGSQIVRLPMMMVSVLMAWLVDEQHELQETMCASILDTTSQLLVGGGAIIRVAFFDDDNNSDGLSLKRQKFAIELQVI